MKPRAVIFDIGNVLIEWQPERFFDAVIGPDRRRSLFEAVDLHGMNDAVDAGGDFAATVASTAARYPQWADAIGLWHSRWIDIASPAIDGSVRLLEALRGAAVPVFLLSNIGAEPFALAGARYGFLSRVDRTYLSGPLGLIKPAAALYAHVEADCGLPPETLLFADDRPENLDAARARGWQTHHFTSPHSLARCLADAGLLPEGLAA